MHKKKLNVLQFICPTGFYGAERWILALAKHLPKSQVNNSLVITLEKNSQDLELVKQFELTCGRTYQLPMSHPFDISILNKLVKLIKKNNIDIIHSHGYKSDILGVIAARLANIISVVTPHGFENSKNFKLQSFIWLGCKAMSYSNAVVPLSPQLLDDSKKVGVNDKKLHYIQNGVDLSEVATQYNKAAISTPKKRIGFIGQMISRKNITDILDIFDELHKKREDIELILLGDGEERAQLEEHSHTLKSAADIHFLGFRDDRLELLQSFDLFVMTSTLEGIPRCLMEACAMGIPVAAYDISGIDQLITHEETGLLAPLGEKEILKNYWIELLDNDKKAKSLAKNASFYVNKHYSAQRMADEYLTLFKQLAQS